MILTGRRGGGAFNAQLAGCAWSFWLVISSCLNTPYCAACSWHVRTARVAKSLTDSGVCGPESKAKSSACAAQPALGWKVMVVVMIMRLVASLIQGQGLFYVCLCSCSHYVWWGQGPYDLRPLPFFWLFWINFIHFAAFGSSGQLWSTTVHLLRMVTVNNWKIRGVS